MTGLADRGEQGAGAKVVETVGTKKGRRKEKVKGDRGERRRTKGMDGRGMRTKRRRLRDTP